MPHHGERVADYAALKCPPEDVSQDFRGHARPGLPPWKIAIVAVEIAKGSRLNDEQLECSRRQLRFLHGGHDHGWL